MHLMRDARLERSLKPLALLALAAAALLVADPALAATPQKSWGGFIGRLHVVVLHLPIGLLIGAFALEFFGIFRRSRGYDVAAAWLFVLGAVSAVVAVVTGMLYGTEWAADNSGQEPMTVWQLLRADTIEQGVTETLGWHMWLGITLMIAAILAAVLKVISVRRQWPEDPEMLAPGGLPLVVARLALIGAMVALPFAGHLGGNMTHGPDKLFARAPFDVPDYVKNWPEDEGATAPTTNAGGDSAAPGDAKIGTVAFWNANIQPALKDHCTACHYSGKQNGGLRLDSLEWAMKGGSIGPSIEAGEARYSELYVRVSLPETHEEFMPTNVKKHGKFTPEEVETLGQWIQEFSGKLTDPKPADGAVADSDPGDDPDAAEPLIDPQAIRAIEDAGGSAQSLSLEQDPDKLTVKFAYLKTLDPAAVAELDATADQVAWLTFEGSGFTDAAADQLPDLPILTRLNLKDTAITDVGLAALPDMPSIEWLNLFGTQITDAGLDSLTRYTTLKKLYVTGTPVTAEAVNKLRAALPDTEVYSDFDEEFQFSLDEPEATSDAKPINTVCPVSGKPIDPAQFVIFEDKKVAFCCGNCKAAFEKEPAKFKAKLP